MSQQVFEFLEYEMLHHPRWPYEAKTVEEVVEALTKVVPDYINKESITEIAIEFLEHYKTGRI